MKNIYLLLIISSVLFLSGCVKNNPDPSWIEIKEFTVEKNALLNNNEGDLSVHAFTNGWVYINEEFIGIFELPCKIPVLKSGAASIRVYPTILNNGVAATKKLFPFTEPYEEKVELVQNASVVIEPVTRYTTGTTFWVEDFEGSTIKMHDGNDTQTSILPQSDDGNTYGRVILTPEAPKWSAYISLEHSDQTPFSFPLGSEIYLEFECKNTHPIKTNCTWVKADGSFGSQVYYGASAYNQGWKKMYIDYTETIAYSGGYGFWFGFSCDLPEGDPEATILIDNIKVVYR